MGGTKRSTGKKAAGTIVRATRRAPAQRVRCHAQWSDESEEKFLDCLAASCNVAMACEEAGFANTTVYRHRRKRADFALKWQAALEQGYARLEMQLVEAASLSLSEEPFPADSPIPRMSAETVIKVLQMHRASVTGQGKRPGWKAPPKRLEEVQDSILRKVEAIRRGREADAGNEDEPQP